MLASSEPLFAEKLASVRDDWCALGVNAGDLLEEADSEEEDDFYYRTEDDEGDD